jgi:hypothetical protein
VGGKRHGEVIAHHAEHHEVHHLGHDGVDLAGHDRRARLNGRQVDFRQAGARSGPEQNQIARDLGQLDREGLQRRRIDDEPMLVPGVGQHVGRWDNRLAKELGEILGDLFRVSLRRVESRSRSPWRPC